MRGVLPEGSHQLLDLLDTSAALDHLVQQSLPMVAELEVERIKVFEDGLLPRLESRSQLGEEEAARGRVLVADMRSFEITVRFLEGIQETFRANVVYPLGDPLEADEQVVL